MESKEDYWADMGMDDEEETLPNEQHAGEDAGEERSLSQDFEGRRLPVNDCAPEQNLALRMRWGSSLACTSTHLRVADEIMTFLGGAPFENEHIDKAVAAMGTAQNLKEEENVMVAREGGSKSVQAGLGQATSQGSLLWSQTMVRHLGSRLTWNMPFAKDSKRITAAWNAWHMLGDFGNAALQAIMYVLHRA